MHRNVFNLATAVSLAIACLVVAVWHRSASGLHDRVRGAAHPPLFSNRKFTITGPPSAAVGPVAAGEAKARQLVAVLVNADLEWRELQSRRLDCIAVDRVDAYPRSGTVAAELMRCDPMLLRRSLLEAVDDPDRFMAAPRVTAR